MRRLGRSEANRDGAGSPPSDREDLSRLSGGSYGIVYFSDGADPEPIRDSPVSYRVFTQTSVARGLSTPLTIAVTW